MVLLTVVATLAAGMVWQQWRAVQVEIAERARAQAGLILTGAVDWVRLMLRENGLRSNGHTQLRLLLDQPLAEMRLSTLLAADRSQSADADIDAFLSGKIDDAQARFNLRNLIVDGKLVPARVAILERLCGAAGLGDALAQQIAERLLSAQLALQASSGDGSDGKASSSAALMPQQLDDLVWLGLDAALVEQLRPLLVLLPVATPVNVNTAPREVLAALLPEAGLGGADRLIRQREGKAFADLAEVGSALGLSQAPDSALLDVRSSFFEVRGRIRLGERQIEERTLVERNGRNVQAIARQRLASVLPAGDEGTR